MSTPRGAVRPRSGQRHSFIFRLIDWLTAAAICAAALAVILFVIYTPVNIKSSGVSDFFPGDLVFASRLGKHLFGYSRGDSVVIGRGDEKRICRAAAFETENVTVAGGRLYINGTLLDESGYAENFPGDTEVSFTVPTGSILLLPDERANLSSEDVSALVIPMNDTVGEVRFIAFPLSRLRLLF